MQCCTEGSCHAARAAVASRSCWCVVHFSWEVPSAPKLVVGFLEGSPAYSFVAPTSPEGDTRGMLTRPEDAGATPVGPSPLRYSKRRRWSVTMRFRPRLPCPGGSTDRRRDTPAGKPDQRCKQQGSEAGGAHTTTSHTTYAPQVTQNDRRLTTTQAARRRRPPAERRATDARATTSRAERPTTPTRSDRQPPPEPETKRRSLSTIATLPARLPKLTITTWNARALLHHRPEMTRKKERHLQRLLRAALAHMGATHTAWSSAMSKPGAGGVAIRVSNRIIEASQEEEIYEVIPGKVLGVRLRMRDDTMLAFFVVHNERLRTPRSRPRSRGYARAARSPARSRWRSSVAISTSPNTTTRQSSSRQLNTSTCTPEKANDAAGRIS